MLRLSRKSIAVAMLPLAALVGCEEEPEEVEIIRPVRAMRVQDASALLNQWYPGIAKATQETDLAFEVSGKLIERPVFIGDEVEAGQVLARLDDRDYRNDVGVAMAERDRAKAQFERIEKAAKSGAVAQQELTDAQAQYNAAEATLRIRQKALDDTLLKAPFAGTVSYTYVENFDNVRAKEPVIRVVDTSRIEFVVNLPESVMPYVRGTYDVKVRFDAFPDHEIPAKIKEIATEPSLTTRTYPINLIMDQPSDIKVLPGMAGRATGDEPPEVVSQRPQNIVVPVTAVFSPKEGDGTFVWIVDEQAKTVSRRQVKTGPLTDLGVSVTEGLEPDELIATAGVHYLEEGQKVTILVQSGDDL